MTPLHVAAESDQYEIVSKYFGEADINIKDNDGVSETTGI